MRATSTLSTITLALLGAQTANAWLLEFWVTQDSCAKPQGSAADAEAGGISCQSNRCMYALHGMRAMLVKDWDDACTVKLYNGNALGCMGGEPFLSYTKEGAREKGLLSDDGTYACLTGLEGEPGLYAASYICE